MKKITLPLMLATVLIISSCNTTRTQRGAMIGAGTGAAVGAVIGSASGNTGVGAAVGTVVGGTAGAIIGKQMDKQAAEIERQVPNAEVIHNEGEHSITVNFSSAVLFQTAKYNLSSQAKSTINDLATILKAYPDTDLVVEGHTDSQGADDYNQTLSENRAKSVSEYLKSLGISGKRITSIGYGESQPIADNATAEGREQNRRVTFKITPNEKMIQDAERQSN